MNDFSLVKSRSILENHENFLQECFYLKDKFSQKFEGQDATFSYKEYNVFCGYRPKPTLVGFVCRDTSGYQASPSLRPQVMDAKLVKLS